MIISALERGHLKIELTTTSHGNLHSSYLGSNSNSNRSPLLTPFSTPEVTSPTVMKLAGKTRSDQYLLLLSISVSHRTYLIPISTPNDGGHRKLQRNHLPWFLGSSSFQYSSSAGQVTVLGFFFDAMMICRLKTAYSSWNLEVQQLGQQDPIQNKNGWPGFSVGLFATDHSPQGWSALKIPVTFVHIFLFQGISQSLQYFLTHIWPLYLKSIDLTKCS